MLIESPAFAYEHTIPAKYTCSGEDVSPPLKFLQIPKEAKTLVLVVDDPDAPIGAFTHWVVWNIPSQVKELSEGAKELVNAKQGTNGFRRQGYNGPCPPPGKPHRYYFKLFALDTQLNVPDGAGKKDVEKAMEGHIIDQAEYMGTFGR